MNLARVPGTQELPRRSDDDVGEIAAFTACPSGFPAWATWHDRRIVRSWMTMIKLTEAQRAVLVQAFPAVGHLAVGGLVFGQFLRQQPFSMGLAFAGIAIWGFAVTSAVMVAGVDRWTNR